MPLGMAQRVSVSRVCREGVAWRGNLHMLVGARLRGCWCWCGVEDPHSLMFGAKATVTASRRQPAILSSWNEGRRCWGEGEGKPCGRSDHRSSINRSTSLSREPLSRMTVNGRFAPVFAQLNTATARIVYGRWNAHLGHRRYGNGTRTTRTVQPVYTVRFAALL